MSFEEWGPFGFGGVQFPLTASTAKSLSEDLDPACFWLVDFLKAMLEKHLGARWTAEAAAAGLTKLDGNPSVIVGSALTNDPFDQIPVFQYDFPILAGFHVFAANDAADSAPNTQDGKPLFSTLHVLFVLPPLDAAQAKKLVPILSGVVKVAKEKVFVAHDPDWQGGADLKEKMGVTDARFVQAEYGSLRGRAQGEQRRDHEAKSFYPTVMIRFQIAQSRLASTAEIANVPFEGADAAISVKDEAGEILIAEVEVNP